MPRTDIDRLPDDSRIWIFPISPSLDDVKRQRLLDDADRFLDQWAAHNVPIRSAREVVEGSFLIVAVDRDAETSGCSIDRMYGLLQQLERELGVKILDPNRVFYRHADGRVHAISREEFRRNGDQHTIVFDTLAERLGDIRSGRWIRRAEDSWHARLLTQANVVTT
jgi:hypothetical protein